MEKFTGIEWTSHKTLSLLPYGLVTNSNRHASILYDANNEGFSLGLAPPTTGLPDAPTNIDSNLSISVENSSTVSGSSLASQFLRLSESPGEAPDFRYDLGTTYTSGSYTVSMDLLFENLENFHIYFRESGSAAISTTNIYFQEPVNVWVQTTSGSINPAAAYLAGTHYNLITDINLDNEILDLTLNDCLIIDDKSIDDAFGSVWIGFEFDAFNLADDQTGFGGIMQVDNFKVTSNSVPEPSILALFGAGILGLGFARRRRHLQS